jgi:hypothetical protein
MPELRYMVLQGLVALQATLDDGEGAEALSVLLAGVTDRNIQAILTRWTQHTIISAIQLHTAFKPGHVGFSRLVCLVLADIHSCGRTS